MRQSDQNYKEATFDMCCPMNSPFGQSCLNLGFLAARRNSKSSAEKKNRRGSKAQKTRKVSQ
jgi:hypothetical protein